MMLWRWFIGGIRWVFIFFVLCIFWVFLIGCWVLLSIVWWWSLVVLFNGFEFLVLRVVSCLLLFELVFELEFLLELLIMILFWLWFFLSMFKLWRLDFLFGINWFLVFVIILVFCFFFLVFLCLWLVFRVEIVFWFGINGVVFVFFCLNCCSIGFLSDLFSFCILFWFVFVGLEISEDLVEDRLFLD